MFNFSRPKYDLNTMSKIQILELKPNNCDLKELNIIETANIIGGYNSEAESSKDIIQKAMQAAVMRSDLSNSNRLSNHR